MSPDQLQSLLAAIVAYSDDAIVSKNLDGIVQSWNSAAERIFGYTAEEMVGQSIERLIPPDRLHEETEILAKLRAGQRIDHFQTIRRHKDGRRLEISVTISPIKNAEGQIVGASKIARDMSEFNRVVREQQRLYQLGKAMAEQRELESLVQLITDAATELSCAEFGAFFYNVRDESGQSYMLYTLSGVPREKFEQFPMPRNTELFAQTFEGNGIVRCDDIALDPRYGKNPPHHGMHTGHLPVRSYLAVPVKERTGTVIGGLFFGHSAAGVFTERAENVVAAIAGHAGIALENARLQQELGETAERFQQLANTIPQLAWMAHPDGEIFWYNDRWYEYTGATPESQLGWGWESIHDPKELPRVVERWKAALASGTTWEDTFPLRRYDGVFRWHLSQARPFRNSSGQVTLWFGTNTDITEQLKMAQERDDLLAAERAARSEAEKVGRMKDEFLATLSHELRTPLNAMLGWSQILQRTEPDSQTMQEGLQTIERNARIQTQLIEELLDMSRIISGKVRLDVQQVELAPIIRAAIDSVRPSADARAIQLRHVLDPLASPVSGDPNRLQQVVWNLLTNAIKFTPKGGKIEVLLERVNSHVEITVADNGQGIRPEFLPHVFDRFRQADSSTTRQQGGLGLGLAIVKQLVEMHGGTVHAKSAGEGLGSTFSVVLPVAVAKHGALDREHPTTSSMTAILDCTPISLDGKRILVVDDEPDARDLVGRLLLECNAQVILAESAEQGLDYMRTMRPDLVISDIGMPHKDGYQFIREVRMLESQSGCKTPAIALTAFARSEDRTRSMIAGYQVHLAKPVEPRELVATVASLIGATGAN